MSKAIAAGFFAPWRVAMAAYAAPIRGLPPWKRKSRCLGFCAGALSAGAEDTWNSRQFAALVIGCTASDTEEDQVPSTASILFTSISLRTASTAASGGVWVSSA